jgi:bacteriorhodopsin
MKKAFTNKFFWYGVGTVIALNILAAIVLRMNPE